MGVKNRQRRAAKQRRRAQAPPRQHRDHGVRPVEEAVTRAFPHLERRSSAITNEAGWVAGTVAADGADLSVGAQLDG